MCNSSLRTSVQSNYTTVPQTSIPMAPYKPIWCCILFIGKILEWQILQIFTYFWRIKQELQVALSSIFLKTHFFFTILSYLEIILILAPSRNTIFFFQIHETWNKFFEIFLKIDSFYSETYTLITQTICNKFLVKNSFQMINFKLNVSNEFIYRSK